MKVELGSVKEKWGRFTKAHWKKLSMGGAVFAVTIMLVVAMLPFVNGDTINVKVNELPMIKNITSNGYLNFQNVTEYTIVVLNVTAGEITIDSYKLHKGDLYIYEVRSDNNPLKIGGQGVLWIGRIAYGDYIPINITVGEKIHVYGYPYLSFRQSNVRMLKLRFPHGVYRIKDDSAGYEDRWIVDNNITYSYRNEFVGDAYVARYNATKDDEFINLTVERVKSFVNLPPRADADGDRVVFVGDEVKFEGWRSVDYDGAIINYTWDFGDGHKGYGVNVTHAYSSPGKYLVNLTVMDSNGSAVMDYVNVTVLPRVEYPSFTYSINGARVEFIGEDNYT